jgi:hypothetical protein
MGVRLALAFYERECTATWIEVVKETEKLLEEYGLTGYDVLISSLPLGKDDLSKFKAKKIVQQSKDNSGSLRGWLPVGFEDNVEDLASAKLQGNLFEIQFNPDEAIDDPRQFAKICIVDTLEQLVNPDPDLDELN